MKAGNIRTWTSLRAAGLVGEIEAMTSGTSPRVLPRPPAMLRPSAPELSRAIVTSRTMGEGVGGLLRMLPQDVCETSSKTGKYKYNYIFTSTGLTCRNHVGKHKHMQNNE